MFDDFKAVDRWSGDEIHCQWRATVVAIATRHADAVDIKFTANDGAAWIAMPHNAWVRYQNETGQVITDPLAIQIAGHYLKSAIENGTYEQGREMYTLTVDEVIEHLHEVMKVFKHTVNIPMMPRIEA